jgi:lysophospholipase L1-like esterase
LEIFAFGDSVTYGRWDKDGGWVVRLRKFLDMRALTTKEEEIFYTIYNLGVPSESAMDILSRFDSEMETRCSEGAGPVIIFATGLTDAVFSVKANRHVLPIETYKKTLAKLLAAAQRYKPRAILFVGPTPVDESRAAPFSWDSNRILKNENIRVYNDTLLGFCKGNGLACVDLYGRMVRAKGFEKRFFDSDYYGGSNDDGIHPNSTGHRLAYSTIKRELIKLVPSLGSYKR